MATMTGAKRRPFPLAVIWIVWLCLGPVSGAPVLDPVRDRNWKLVGITLTIIDEHTLPLDDEYRDMTVILTGNVCLIKSKTYCLEFPFKIDASKTPNEIDIVCVNGEKKEVINGIYTIEKDTAKICFHCAVSRPPVQFSLPPETPRPKDFKPSPMWPGITLTFQREKSR